jgi:CMP-N,N'-diacetyllegionaminic acid synthase
MKHSVIAIIPARSGSKSIKDKNLALLGGYPLISYSIVAAKLSRRINRVILSTDSERYAEIGRRYGAETPFLRPAEYCSDKSTDQEFMAHAMQWSRDSEGHLPELWVHLRPTTPLRDPMHLDAAVTALESRPEATALRSAHPSPESPFKWLRRNEAGYLTALTTDETNLDRFNLPRQSYPTAFIPDGYVDIVRSSFVLEGSLLHGDRVFGFESPYCTEVDSVEELELLEFQLHKQGSPLLEYLKLNFKN